MLGETYENVTEHYKFIAEKVQHTPDQILCCRMEGEHYVLETYDSGNLKLAFGGGRGQMNLAPKGINEVYFKKYDE